MDLIGDMMRALAFLSRLPVPQRWFDGYTGALAGTVRGFPLAGMIIALPAALVLLIAFLLDLPELVAALLAVMALVVTTGALHEDGLADVADGFYGGSSPERRLEIMKDSAIGAYGMLALVFSVLLRTALLAEILDALAILPALLVVIGTEAVSRAVLVKFWQTLPSARMHGVAGQAGTPAA
ncbi:MAG: adenosylcobinamide-GDP ribazoletransferase, partial [Alphaproteobacteria bacterium]